MAMKKRFQAADKLLSPILVLQSDYIDASEGQSFGYSAYYGLCWDVLRGWMSVKLPAERNPRYIFNDHDIIATKCVANIPENFCQGNFPFKQSYGLCIQWNLLNSLEGDPHSYELVSCQKCGAVAQTMSDSTCSDCQNICISSFKIQHGTTGVQEPEQVKSGPLARQIITDAKDYRSEAWITRMYGHATQRHGLVQPEF
ncbi:hypothetical protein F5146DRAFT_1004361 [Armillaria mellea]|nr:hypothetical protein F5146DRAFT_1004361 [Armillaria mellea]